MATNLPRIICTGPSNAWAVLALIWVLGGGCGQAYLGPPPDTPQTQLEYARYLLENERYYDAIMELSAFTSENPGSGLLDTALFYLGEAYLGRRDYPMAAAEFERLLREFPGSGHAPAARYSLGVAYCEQSLPADLDPTMTERAIEQLLLFMRLHPESRSVAEAQRRVGVLRDKMAEKRFLNGGLYIKLKQPEAARFYFESVAGEYPETKWAPKSMLGIAKSYEMEKNAAAAIGRYRELLRIYPESEEAGEARERLLQLGVDAAGRGQDLAGEDSEEDSDEEEP